MRSKTRQWFLGRDVPLHGGWSRTQGRPTAVMRRAMSGAHVPHQFDARHERIGETGLLLLEGEFDLACEAGFEAALDALMAGRPQGIVVDLSALTFIDSSGLNALLGAWRRTAALWMQFAVVPSTNEHVRTTMRISGVDELFPVVVEASSSNGNGRRAS
jgi:anti-sigma B factor antagonist